MQHRPQYAIDSVDNALWLLQLLRDQGRLRVKDAAAELGIAPSTTHRLLTMLVYRGFAVQDESHAYLPGPGLDGNPVRTSWTRALRDVAHPYLELLAGRLNESVNLMIRVGATVRFLSTVESSNVLRVSNRQGQVLPAHRTSGGKVLLATVDEQVLERLYRSQGADIAGERMADAEYAAFRRELRGIARQGYALNRGSAESGVCAIGVALRGASGRPIAAVSIATPASRFPSILTTEVLNLAFRAREDISAELAERGIDAP
ncbi:MULTISPECIES: IclR family transcriptional regulator [unclassified Diaminobutyricimonas]|uniref:IclR family transcriptional regulator n=1 Tax=unclassified Diaminobutyricimonas TaxID=2643261 RepID=UPI0012F47B3B|nr:MULTISPECIES: IclR family transcriptional regulator [unclassified Diaminobutyricimonas]